ADPTPAFSFGNEPMIESVAGAMMFAIPTPSSTVMTITHNVELFVPSVTISSCDDPATNIPDATTTLFPKRWTHRGDNGASTIIVIDCGIRMAPALTVE